MEKKISFIIPAKNEEKRIKRAIISIKKACTKIKLIPKRYEIIVVDNLSTDKTLQIAKNEKVKVIKQNKEPSIAKTRNKGAQEAQGEIIIFVDADSKITPKLLKRTLNIFNNKDIKIKAISTITKFNKYNSFKSYGVYFYNFFSLLFKLGVGQFMAFRKKDFLNIKNKNAPNGFNEKIYAFEDIEILEQLKKKEIIILKEGIISSDRKFLKKDTINFLFKLIAFKLGYRNFAKNKNKLGFWYSDKKEIKSNYLKYKKTLFAFIFVMFLIEYINNNWFDNSFKKYETIAIFIIFLSFSGLVFDYRKNKKFKNLGLIVFFIITLILEIIGHKKGLPFGKYEYNHNIAELGLLGVPLFIPLAWCFF